jgi:uncharacterized protein (UPF0216 family)
VNFNDRLSKFLKHEIESVNIHLPKKRVSLAHAAQGYNFYVNREEQQLYIDKKEIKFLHKICPENKHKDVFLPILIIRRRDLGRGTYIISGELIDQFLVLSAMKKFEGTWEDFKKDQLPLSKTYLYKPDLVELRKVLPTSTIIGFS